jgi:alanine-synthesizing transaminase
MLMTSGLRTLGWELTCPSAAASVWARIPEGLLGDEQEEEARSISFARKFLEKHNVILLPGALFGEQYDDFVRFALVRNDEGLREVLHRIDLFAGEVSGGKV